MGWVSRVVQRMVPAPVLARLVSFRKHAIPESRWNQQYADREWDYMAKLPELGRYSVIAGYCQHLKPAGTVLDIGCGAGLLAQRLAPGTHYIGIDLSQAAVDQADQLHLANATFIAADANRYEPTQQFDMIVFNESLWYLKNPGEQVKRYQRFLAPGGYFVVSMWYAAETIPAWNSLTPFKTVDRLRLHHLPTRQTWNLAIYQG